MKRDYYKLQIKSISAKIETYKSRSKIFLALELVSFALLLFVLYQQFFLTHVCLFPYNAIFCAVVYGVARFFDHKNSSQMDLGKRIRKVYENELLYLEGNFSPFADGEQYIDKQHSYSVDMDLFGKSSLFNRINRTVTSGGSDFLANSLRSLPDSADEVGCLKESISELSGCDALRTSFAASVTSYIESDKILSVIDAASSSKVGPLFRSRIAMVFVFTLITLLFVSIALSVVTPLSANVPIMMALLMLFLSLAVASKTLNHISRIVNRMTKDLEGYANLFKVLETADFKAEYNRRITSRLFGPGEDSLAALHELSRILAGIDRRGNVLGLIFANAFFCSDFFLVRRFVRWQQTNLAHLHQWIDCISRMDGLMSMANFRFNHPEAVDADITNVDNIVYEAVGLYHPFIGKDKAVKNDFTVADREFYIITGANMAGKSTFLRSIGINYILAMNGMPVFADSLKVSVFTLFTSMCTTDDITRGISYFNAELIRLQQLIAACRQSTHTLIILDEILKGTNSLDKLNGSRLFLQSISSLPVSGVIATHDLELSKMADGDALHFHNYCFEVELGDKITYSYHISPGVARNQNATFLLNNILKGLK